MAPLLVVGILFVFMGNSEEAQASLLSKILGTEASADLNKAALSTITNNSQTMALLQANVVGINLKENKQEDTPNEGVNINIVADSAILPTTSPLGASSTGGDEGNYSFDQVSIYTVRPGDTISQIAEMFDVSVETIRAANDLKKGEKLVTGDVLLILPISGLEHTVTKGQTLATIAAQYKANVGEIALYNGIAKDAKLTVGDKIIIPGGEMADEGGDKPAPNLDSAPARDKNYYAKNPVKGLLGFFVNPLPSGRKTQGLHGPGHRGVDIGAPIGTSIYAAASGQVIAAKMGWNGGYGNMVIVQHNNGTKTLYAHMTKLGTSTGASVSQGQVIGYVGSTGKSTGPHLHFEVFNAKNPGSDWSWKK